MATLSDLIVSATVFSFSRCILPWPNANTQYVFVSFMSLRTKVEDNLDPHPASENIVSKQRYECLSYHGK